MSTLTVVMIVRNEEQFIEEVIKNVQPIADDIVITDTGSTDKTIDIIKKFDVRLFNYKWDRSYARVHNFTLSRCRTDWILFIDADQFIDVDDYDKIRQLLSNKNKYIAYRIFEKNYFNPKVNLKNLQRNWKGSYITHSSIRIFKNGERIFYSGPTYVSVIDSLRDRIDMVGNSNVVFHHLDILRNRHKKEEKINRYYSDVFENFKMFPNDPEINYSLAHYYGLEGKFDKATEYHKRTLKLNPKHIKAKLSLGLSYIMLEEEEKGMRLIRKCQTSNNAFPWEVEAYLNYAYSVIATRMLEKAKRTKNGYKQNATN